MNIAEILRWKRTRAVAIMELTVLGNMPLFLPPLMHVWPPTHYPSGCLDWASDYGDYRLPQPNHGRSVHSLQVGGPEMHSTRSVVNLSVS